MESKSKGIATRLSLLLITFFSYFVIANAQVTIGSDITPEDAALLDLKEYASKSDESSSSKGVLLPRVGLQYINELLPLIKEKGTNYESQKLSHKGLTVYNINTVPDQNLIQGVYIWDGQKWQRSASNRGPEDFFYMPSIPINTTQTGTKTLDLYTLYKNQFFSPRVASTGAPASIPYYANATDLYYYVTDYDTTVFSNISISDNGIMTYTIKEVASAYSFMNIVFVIK